jgi:hypothetical protein
MASNPWVPFLASSSMELLAFIVALLFAPETNHLVNNPSFAIPPSNDTRTSISAKELPKLLAEKLSGSLKKAKEMTGLVWKSLKIILIFLVFLAATLTRQAMALLLQYVTKRFHWTYGKVRSPIRINPSTFSALL